MLTRAGVRSKRASCSGETAPATSTMISVLDDGGVLVQLALDAEFLRERHQAAGAGLQRRHAVLAARVRGQEARRSVRGREVGGHQQRVRLLDAQAGRLVQQQRHRQHRFGPRARLDLHLLVRLHARLRQQRRLAVDAHRAVLDQQLGLAPRAARERGHALGQSDALGVLPFWSAHEPTAACCRMRATCAASERAATGHSRSGTSS